MRFLEAGDVATAQVVIIGAPFEGASSYRKGSALGPLAIRRASQSIESFSAVFRTDLRDVALGDAGDMALSDRVEDALAQIADAVETHLQAGRRTVLLGGDHSVTIGAVAGVRRLFPDIQVVVLDAHSDWRDSYDGSRYSHACTVRRLWEMTDGRVWVVGARSFVGNEDWSRYVGLEEVLQKLDPHRPTYLSVDLDAFDPSLCPGVGNPEPGGLRYEQAIALLCGLRAVSVIGVDVVELHPPYDPSETTAITAAKLVQESILAFWAPR
ncbi:Agmatinase [bacterium HR17]|jgi:agmatinase|uniref:Agmatinase n=1 Tax=Candidatus Fervidibacter japonicus TaxID=2035412 RepID=A0A2H5X9M0_9BACT|nr:Agmatinase [bacterium HR17]